MVDYIFIKNIAISDDVGERTNKLYEEIVIVALV